MSKLKNLYQKISTRNQMRESIDNNDKAKEKFAVMSATLTHNELIHGRMAKQFFTHDTQLYDCYKTVKPGSLLASSYNYIWCKALQRQRELNLRYVAILHADIVPDDFWIDKLIAEAELFNADIMSAIVPIKEASGVTSTAISSDDIYAPYMRLTQRQINDPLFPKTFDIDMLRDSMEKIDPLHRFVFPNGQKLLVNTGCCVIRVDRPWSEKAYFTINDRIRKVNGVYISEVESEDWFFSRFASDLGAKVMATTRVVTDHIGPVEFTSTSVWGESLDMASIQYRYAQDKDILNPYL